MGFSWPLTGVLGGPSNYDTTSSLGHKTSDIAILSKAEINYRDEKIKMKDSKGRHLLLRLKYKWVLSRSLSNASTGSRSLSFSDSRSRGTKITLYSPFVMVNRTTFGLQVKPKGSIRDYSAGATTHEASANFFMFSFQEFEEPNSRAIVTVGDSEWSRVSGTSW